MSDPIPAGATPDELKKFTEALAARRAAYEELTKSEAAVKAWQAAQAPMTQVPPSPDATSAAAKELAALQTTQAAARKAQVEAAVAERKALVDSVPNSGITGTADLAAGAGNAEAMLLGAVAVRALAANFACEIAKERPGSECLVCTPATVPDFQALTTFDLNHTALGAAMEQARQATQDVEGAAELRSSLAVATAVGTALTVADKVLGFFRSDFKFQGMEVASSDDMLVAAVAEQLLQRGMPVVVSSGVKLRAPDATNEVLQHLTEPIEWALEARRRQRGHERAVATLTTQLAALDVALLDPAATEEARQAAQDEARDLRARLTQAEQAVTTWQTLADRVDQWTLSLTTVDAKGQLPVAGVVQLAGLRTLLDAGAIVVVLQLHKVAGSGYTKRNVWSTLLWFNPFHVMGGAVASYTAFDGKTGQLLAASLQPWHGGYQGVADVEHVTNLLPTRRWWQRIWA